MDRDSKLGAGLEACGILALILTYIWLFRGRGPSVAVIVVLVLLSHWWHGETPASLGFTTTGLRRAARVIGPVVIVLALMLGGDALLRPASTRLSLSTILVVLAGYCVWGVVQQWALNGFFVNRFVRALGDYPGGRYAAAVLAAICFGAAHLPNLYLALPSAALGLLAALAYLRYRNLIVLGIAHGIIGTTVVVTMAASLPHGLRTGPDARAFSGRSRPSVSISARSRNHVAAHAHVS